VGHFRDHIRNEAETRLETRIPLGGTQSRRSPYDRQTLERLLVVEALCTGTLGESESDIVISEIRDILARDLPDASPADRSYPLSLLASLGSASDRELADCFGDILNTYRREALWYDDLRFDSLVLLNAARAQHAIDPELYESLWDEAVPLLRRLWELAEIPTSLIELVRKPAHLAQVGPYARILLTSPPSVRWSYTKESAGWLNRANDVVNAERHRQADEEQSIADALCEVVRKSLVMSSTIEPLSGGLSSSAVFSATLNVDQPFRISGARVIYKTDVSPQEREVYSSLQLLDLHRLFARVLSEPAFVTLADGSRRSVFVYEHLAPRVTLFSLLDVPRPLEDKMRLVSSVVQRLSDLWDHEVSEPVRSDFSDMRRAILRLTADLFLISVPIIKSELQNLVDETQHLVQSIALTSYPAKGIVHGDMNCRNIMLEASDDDASHLKLIDYETLQIGGDPLVDIGELIEDVHQACGLAPDEETAASVVLDATPAIITARLGTRDAQLRLLLSQLRSCCALTEFSLLEIERRPVSIPLMSRWRLLLDRISATGKDLS
jgi:Ecdysteroid kinase-like family